MKLLWLTGGVGLLVVGFGVLGCKFQDEGSEPDMHAFTTSNRLLHHWQSLASVHSTLRFRFVSECVPTPGECPTSPISTYHAAGWRSAV